VDSLFLKTLSALVIQLLKSLALQQQMPQKPSASIHLLLLIWVLLTHQHSLHSINDNTGKLGAEYVVQSGSKSYSASVAADGTVKLNKANVTYSDVENGVATATQSGQLVQVGVNDKGTAVGFVSVQGKITKSVHR
jgi:biopolymer transport protein ExbD